LALKKIKDLVEIRERLKEISKTIDYLSGSIDIIINELVEGKK
jgi:hypothetical protein